MSRFAEGVGSRFRARVFWTGGIANPLTVIEQISFLMFAGLLDMRESTEEKR